MVWNKPIKKREDLLTGQSAEQQPGAESHKPPDLITPQPKTLPAAKSKVGDLAVPAYIQPDEEVQQIDDEDKVLPRLKLLQALSPEIKIKAGNPGDIINAVSLENYGTDIIIVPIMFWKMAIKWHPRTPDGAGGGLVDICDNLQTTNPVSRNGEELTGINWSDEIVKSNDKTGKLGDYWAKVYNFLILINDDTMPIVLTLTRTKIRAAKKLIGFYDVLLNETMKRYPWYARTYQINVVEENKGDWSYYNFDIMPVVNGPAVEVDVNGVAWTRKDRYDFAAKLVANFRNKEVKVDLDGVDGEEHR